MADESSPESRPLALIHTYPQGVHRLGLRALDDFDRPFEPQRLMLVVCENQELTYALLAQVALTNMRDGMKVVYGPTDPLRRANARFRRSGVSSMSWDSMDVKGSWGAMEKTIVELYQRSGGILSMVFVEDLGGLATQTAKVLEGAKSLARRKNIAIAMGITSLPKSWRRGQRLHLDKIAADLGAEDLILHLQLPGPADETATLNVVRARHTAETTYPVSMDDLRALVMMNDPEGRAPTTHPLLRVIPSDQTPPSWGGGGGAGGQGHEGEGANDSFSK